MDDIGIYMSRVDRPFNNGSATGLSGIWRQSGNLNLGVRVGVGDLGDAGETVLVGAELYGGLGRLLIRVRVLSERRRWDQHHQRGEEDGSRLRHAALTRGGQTR